MKYNKGGGDMGAVYGLGLIGAAIYYLSAATGLWAGVIGLVKAVLWPAYVVYELLALFNI